MSIKPIDVLREMVAHTDFIVEELIDNLVRIDSAAMQFDFEFESVEQAMDFVTDII